MSGMWQWNGIIKRIIVVEDGRTRETEAVIVIVSSWKLQIIRCWER